MRNRTSRRGAAAVLLPLLILTITACGAAEKGPGVASVTSPTSTGSGSGSDADGASGSEPMTDKEMEEAALKFTECMREHGVDMPDPTTENGIVMEAPHGAKAVAEMEAAQKACEDLMPKSTMSPEEEAEMKQELLEFAQCMREHGVDMPDPTVDGGIEVEVPDGPDGMAEMEAAQEACGEALGGGMSFRTSE